MVNLLSIQRSLKQKRLESRFPFRPAAVKKIDDPLFPFTFFFTSTSTLHLYPHFPRPLSGFGSDPTAKLGRTHPRSWV